MSDDLERAIAFWCWLQDRTSTRIEPFRWGNALFNDTLPERYFSNFVRVEKSLTGVEAFELAQETDRAMADFEHSQIQMRGEREAARLMAGLVELGFDVEHSATLAWRHRKDRTLDIDLVEELPFSQARTFLVEVYRRAMPDADLVLVERFADFLEVIQQAVGTRFFGRRTEGIGSLCELCVHDGLGQVEHLDTLEEFRGKGLAGSIVLRAAAEAGSAGADLVCIDADVDDLAINLYRRLGFVEIGRSWAFTRPPGRTGGAG